jgi:hypothetical protein
MPNLSDDIARWWRRDRALLDALRPGLRALIAARVNAIPDYVPEDDARQLVLDAVGLAIDHQLGHLPELVIAGNGLMTSARQIVDLASCTGAGQPKSVAQFKAFVLDRLTARVESVSL